MQQVKCLSHLRIMLWACSKDKHLTQQSKLSMELVEVTELMVQEEWAQTFSLRELDENLLTLLIEN